VRPARRVVAWWIAAGTLGRIALAAALGLGVDETYAVAIARPLSWSYFEHPPLAFWIAAGATELGGWSPLVVRLPFIALVAATTWLLYRLAAMLFGERAGVWTAAIVTVTPVLSIAAGSWVVPDGPLDLALVAAALCLHRATDEATPDDSATRWWLAAGLCTGLALLAKYHGAFLLVGTGAYLATTPSSRRWLARWQPYAAALLALTCFAPVLAWNAGHGWASFAFQGGRSGTWTELHATSLLQNVAGQALWIGPWIWIALVVAFGGALRAGPRDPRRWLLCCLGAGPVAVFTLAALGGRPGLPHWPAPGYLLLLPLLGTVLADAERAGRRWPSAWLASAAVVLLGAAFLVATDVRTGWLQRMAPRAFAAGDPSTQALDWTPLRHAVDGAPADGAPRREGMSFVAVSSWVTGAKAGYALRGTLPVVCVCEAPHQFAYQHDASAFLGRDALVVLGPDGGPPSRDLAAAFTRIEPLPDVLVMRGGQVAIRLRTFIGHGFQRPVATSSR
jgi:4-amino-4-deoxy-L-arabinose transferase-like glycosyltransferase